MNKEFIDLCYLKRSKMLKISWEEIAEKHGYKNGECARTAFKRYRKNNNLLPFNLEGIPEDLKRNAMVASNAGLGINGKGDNMELVLTNINPIFLPKQKPRLVVSDIHLPFAVDGWLDFMVKTHAKYDCHEEVIINGDLFDNHALSFHTSETDARNAIDEYELAKGQVAKLVKAFPKALFLTGNHDVMLARKNKENGIDERFIKTFHQLFNLPDTWRIQDDAIVNGVYYRHIGSCGGKMGALNSAVSNRMSTVTSHLHANGGVLYATAPNGEMIFGLNTGALVDEDSYAFRYGRFSRFKATLGCGVVFDSRSATFEVFRK